MCYLITYVYNEYFWDNSVAKNILFAALCIYLLGIWLISALIFMSVVFKTTSGVCVGTGCVFFISYTLSIIPDATKYLPTKLMESGGLLMGNGTPKDYWVAIAVAMVMAVGFFFSGIVIFNNKEI
jgi:ABC-2 type transport system permease protein